MCMGHFPWDRTLQALTLHHDQDMESLSALPGLRVESRLGGHCGSFLNNAKQAKVGSDVFYVVSLGTMFKIQSSCLSLETPCRQATSLQCPCENQTFSQMPFFSILVGKWIRLRRSDATHWCRDEMAAILQTTFQNAFSSLEKVWIWIKTSFVLNESPCPRIKE